jgi:hypothetical protein
MAACPTGPAAPGTNTGASRRRSLSANKHRCAGITGIPKLAPSSSDEIQALAPPAEQVGRSTALRCPEPGATGPRIATPPHQPVPDRRRVADLAHIRHQPPRRPPTTLAPPRAGRGPTPDRRSGPGRRPARSPARTAQRRPRSRRRRPRRSLPRRLGWVQRTRLRRVQVLHLGASSSRSDSPLRLQPHPHLVRPRLRLGYVADLQRPSVGSAGRVTSGQHVLLRCHVAAGAAAG